MEALEEFEHAEETFAGLFGELCQCAGVYTGEHDVGAQTIDKNDAQRIEDSLAQVFNLKNVLYGF